MAQQGPKLVITTAPFVREGATTRRLMFEVLLGLVPILIAAMYFFGISALLVVTASVLGAVMTEFAFSGTTPRGAVIKDGSGVLTGALLAFTLPPAIPLWMAFLGGAISIGLGKVIWGGLGRNLFNPALVGRAFLQAAFPSAMMTWTAPGGGFFDIVPSTWAPPFFQTTADITSSATALGMMKQWGEATPLDDLLYGGVGGSLGETSALVLVALGVILCLRRTFDWRLFVAPLIGAALLSGALYLADSSTYPNPLFMLLSGGLLFAAVFMTTDPVTSPLSKKGSWIYGIGVGLLVVLIRLFANLPEAVMYAVLLMNAVVPHIDRYTQPRRFGG